MKYAIATALTLTASIAGAQTAGYSPFTVTAPHHEREMRGAIWYPSEGDAPSEVVAQNPVFHGVTVHPEADVKAGSYPIVVLSHGMGGNTRSLAWLATGLAERGAVVVNVNHPNSTWGDFDLAAGLQHWTRVQDLSLALDKVLSDPRFAGQLDTSRVMAAGFSYGGWTALSMGGLQGNHEGYVAHCAEHGAASVHCDDLMSAEIRLADVDATAWNAAYADPRISHVVAIDPGLVWGLETEDTAGLTDHLRIIGFGAGEDRLLAADFDASGLSALLPDAQIDNVVPATHFTAMPLCTPMGAAILVEENDDPVCTDPEGTDRAAVHAQIIDMIMQDLAVAPVLSQ